MAEDPVEYDEGFTIQGKYSGVAKVVEILGYELGDAIRYFADEFGDNPDSVTIERTKVKHLVSPDD